MIYSKQDVLHNESQSIKNGAASTIAISLSNNYFILFAIAILGATNYQVGLISSLPSIVGMAAMLPAAFMVNKLEEKRKFTAYSIFFTRFFLLIMVFLPFIKSDHIAWFFVILIALMNFPGTFLNLSWQAFIGDLIPADRRNTFFGNRNRILTFTGMIVTLVAGICMKSISPKSALPYQLLFLFAFIFGMIEFLYILKHKEEKQKIEISNHYSPFSKHLFQYKPYITFLVCALFFNFAWQMAWSLFSIYQIRFAHATAFWISLFTVSNQLSQIVSFRWWAKMANRYSNTQLLIWISIGMASAPILNILSTNYVYLFIVNFTSGFFVSGTVLILFNSLLEATEEEHRTSYIANYNFLLSIVAFIAPQFGVFLLESFSMNIAMIISTIFRGLAGVLFGIMAYKMSHSNQLDYKQNKISL
ncbi:MFS transporter [Gottfriedia acidiceleris]|uniref:MFS transporter n=1 Tax=Gottfriedia acidiceleris TaxID=371036 RepID=UPI003D1D1D8E